MIGIIVATVLMVIVGGFCLLAIVDNTMVLNEEKALRRELGELAAEADALGPGPTDAEVAQLQRHIDDYRARFNKWHSSPWWTDDPHRPQRRDAADGVADARPGRVDDGQPGKIVAGRRGVLQRLHARGGALRRHHHGDHPQPAVRRPARHLLLGEKKMSKSQRIVQLVAALAPLGFATLACYHSFKAIPTGGYVVATHAFQAIFCILIAIFIVLVGTHRNRDR